LLEKQRAYDQQIKSQRLREAKKEAKSKENKVIVVRNLDQASESTANKN